TVILIALAGPIVGVLYGAKYEPVINLMRIVCFPRAMYALLGAGTAVILGLNRPGFALKVAASLGVLSLGLNFLLIPRYGALGAAIGTSIAEVLMLPIYIWWVERNIKVLWPLGDGLRILMASVPAGLAMYLISHLFGPFPALCLGLLLGGILLIVGLVMFGAVRQEDIQRFDGLERLLPSRLRRVYGAFIGLVSRLVQARQTLLGRV
ncbi:MAG: polysaccharide biosynthesis C-terminal domain-containing protein, partial [Candidatus Bathyarchaeota archaeon]|nr:polysaccharide biosynthesis C-terminal domain-containing protein [Candidatus Bathyarchaeota archaeon]